MKEFVLISVCIYVVKKVAILRCKKIFLLSNAEACNSSSSIFSV